VVPLMNWYKLPPEDLIVAHDDMDIPAGTIRIRKKGSAGGHNGIKSVLAHLGDEHFSRVRIGIGRPLPGWTVINHVLAPFQEEDVPKIREAIEYLLPAVECMVTEDTDKAMNLYNPKKVKKQKQKAEQENRETQEGGAA
jgi:PTH1 family peptidyl-tRNA hydrolase